MKYQSAITSLAAVVLASSTTLDTVSSFVPTPSTARAVSTQSSNTAQNTQLAVASSEIIDNETAKPRKTREVRIVSYRYASVCLLFVLFCSAPSFW